LLAVKGLPAGAKPNIRILAERMQLQHHSAVELIDRLVDRGFLCRLRATDDRRQVLVKLTDDGEEFVQKLALRHWQELQSVGPRLVEVMRSLIAQSTPPEHDEMGSEPVNPQITRQTTKG
jgi:DNA-binding MarR family transcriptional regulator